MTGPRDTFRKRMARFQSPAFVAAVRAAMYECADAVRAEAFQSISRGAISGKGHVASKPGEPPNRDTGVLQAGLRVEQPSAFVGRVVSGAPYAGALEFGSSKIAARPYMRPARDKVKPQAERILAARINRATKAR